MQQVELVLVNLSGDYPSLYLIASTKNTLPFDVDGNSLSYMTTHTRIYQSVTF